jgi:hypothetical protein
MKTRSKRNSRPPNGFSFFVKWHSRKYKGPSRERMVVAGKLWRSLPDDVKNNFTKYAHDEHILKNTPPVNPIHADDFNENHKHDVFIFDKRSAKPYCTTSTNGESSSSLGDEYFDFDKFDKEHN